MVKIESNIYQNSVEYKKLNISGSDQIDKIDIIVYENNI